MFRKLVRAGAAALAVALGTGAAHAETGGWLKSIMPTHEGEACAIECSNFTLRLNGLYLHRESESASIFDGEPLRYDFGHEFGTEISLTAAINRCWDVEARFFEVEDWQASAIAVDEGEGETDVFLSTITSQLRSAELTFGYRATAQLKILTGIRYIALNERVTGAILFVEGEGEDVVTIPVDVSVRNDMIGAQLGASFGRSFGQLEIEGIGKAGIYHNRAEVTGAVFGPLSAESRDIAFALEGTLAATYRLNELVAIRGGYQLLWLDHVATAAGQIGGGDVDNNQSVLYHGGFLGLEVRW